jgi:anti-sigma factor RsiW
MSDQPREDAPKHTPEDAPEEVLLDLVLGFLEPDEEEAWNARCAEDPDLAARVEVLRSEQGVLADVLSLDPAASDLEDRLVAGLRAAPTLPRERSFRWGPLVAAAAGLLIAALLGAWGSSFGDEPPRQQLIHKTRVSELEALGLGGVK